jgi:hypothetical protein
MRTHYEKHETIFVREMKPELENSQGRKPQLPLGDGIRLSDVAGIFFK